MLSYQAEELCERLKASLRNEVAQRRALSERLEQV